MSGFFLLCLLSLLALPSMVVWYTGLELIGPLVWRLRLLGQASKSPQALLPATNSIGFLLDNRPETRLILDEITATPKTWFTRDFSARIHNYQVYVRSQPRAVNESGSKTSIPYTLEEMTGTHSVVAIWVLVSLGHKISKQLKFHIEAGLEERAYGRNGLLAGLLDSQARNLLGEGDKLSFSDGYLTLEAPFLLKQRSPSPVILGLVRIAERLSSACDPKNKMPRTHELLLENFKQDPDPRVRAKATEFLLKNHHSDVIQPALEDPAPLVRFTAARHLGYEGFHVIVSILTDSNIHNAKDRILQQRALKFLIRTYPLQKVLPILKQLVENGPQTLRTEIFNHLAQIRHPSTVTWMTSVLQESDTDTVVAGCEVLAKIPGAKSEVILIELLQRPDRKILQATLKALAQIGTRRSARALQDVCKRATTRNLRITAETTLQLILTRELPEGTGQLSLLDDKPKSGAVSPLKHETQSEEADS